MINDLNVPIYDELADEYESRVKCLMPVTEETIDYFSSYLRPNSTILDIGCAVGTALSVFRKRGFKPIGIEISSKMVEYARTRNPGTEIILGDFLKTEFSDKFDAVFSFAFIHLFSKIEADQILKKIKDLLKEDGVAFISTTEATESKEGWYEKEDYNKKVKRFRKFWTENELRAFMEKAGFKVVALKKFVDPFAKVWMDFIVQKNTL